MSDFGYVGPDDGSAPVAYAESVQRIGWIRTLGAPATLAVVTVPVFFLPSALWRAVYFLPAFALWWAGYGRLVDWSLRRPVEREADRRDDETQQPRALTGAHRKHRGEVRLRELERHTGILDDPLTVAHVQLGAPRFAGEEAAVDGRAQRYVDALLAQTDAARAVVVRTAADELVIGFPYLEPEAVRLTLAAAETVFAVSEGGDVSSGLALLEDGEVIADVIARARAASGAP